MSNCSSVFTTNDYQQVSVEAIGLSEYDYQIHPLYMLLVAFNSKVISLDSPEDADEEKTAIVGDFEQGKALVLKFLELVLAYSESYSSDSFTDFVETSREIFKQRNEKYVVLECVEIVQLGGTNFVPGMIPELEEIKTEVESLYARHLKGDLTGQDFSEMSFYNEFDEICTYYCQIEVEDIEWEYFWTNAADSDLEE